MQTCELDIDGILFNGVRIPTQNGTILLIQGRTANLGCGYFATATAVKLNDRFAVVTGVGSFADMMEAKVIAVSAAAASCGVTVGMNGRNALLTMEKC